MEQTVHQTNNETVLNLRDLLGVLWRRLWIILLAAAIAGGACFAYKYYTYTEQYTSTAQLFILNAKGLESGNASASSVSYYYSLALSMVEDCKELLVSDTVLRDVADELNLDVAPKVLKDMVKIEDNEKSRILKVSVTTGNPELSKEIVDSLCKFGKNRISEITGGEQISVFEEGTFSRVPSNDVGLTLPVLAALGAAILVYGIFLLVHVLDDKINESEDVETVLGLTVLGEIPFRSGDDSGGRNSKRYGKFYSKYYSKYYGRYGGKYSGK